MDRRKAQVSRFRVLLNRSGIPWVFFTVFFVSAAKFFIGCILFLTMMMLIPHPGA